MHNVLLDFKNNFSYGYDDPKFNDQLAMYEDVWREHVKQDAAVAEFKRLNPDYVDAPKEWVVAILFG